MARAPVWDAPVRLFHWVLAALVVFSYVTAKVAGSWMEWHLRSGYCILALLAFRIAWGFAGGTTARFSSFLSGPRSAMDYLRGWRERRGAPVAGHNPLGGWSVVAMLVVLLVQAGSGLFVDDEIFTQGPLAVKVSNATVGRMSAIHDFNQWLVVGLVALHVAAIAFYQLVAKVNLVGPMLHGGELPAGMPARNGSNALAAILLAAAAAAVYYLVVIYPRSPA